jgi:hypothetical protein
MQICHLKQRGVSAPYVPTPKVHWGRCVSKFRENGQATPPRVGRTVGGGAFLKRTVLAIFKLASSKLFRLE